MKKLIKCAAAVVMATVFGLSMISCQQGSEDTNLLPLLAASNNTQKEVDYTDKFEKGWWKYTVEVNGVTENKYFFYKTAKDTNAKGESSLGTSAVYGLNAYGNEQELYSYAGGGAGDRAMIEEMRASGAYTWEKLYKDAVLKKATFKKISNQSLPSTWDYYEVLWYIDGGI